MDIQEGCFKTEGQGGEEVMFIGVILIGIGVAFILKDIFEKKD